jgi:hypothetical protein
LDRYLLSTASETDAMTKTKDSWLVRLSQMDLWLVVGVFGTVLLLILPVPRLASLPRC